MAHRGHEQDVKRSLAGAAYPAYPASSLPPPALFAYEVRGPGYLMGPAVAPAYLHPRDPKAAQPPFAPQPSASSQSSQGRGRSSSSMADGTTQCGTAVSCGESTAPSMYTAQSGATRMWGYESPVPLHPYCSKCVQRMEKLKRRLVSCGITSLNVTQGNEKKALEEAYAKVEHKWRAMRRAAKRDSDLASLLSRASSDGKAADPAHTSRPGAPLPDGSAE